MMFETLNLNFALTFKKDFRAVIFSVYERTIGNAWEIS